MYVHINNILLYMYSVHVHVLWCILTTAHAAVVRNRNRFKMVGKWPRNDFNKNIIKKRMS